jgi:transcriptional regulator with XRE-family HTH domain
MPTREFMRLSRRLATILRSHRKQLGLTQEDVAAEAGIPVRRYQKIEAAGQNLTLETIARLSRVLKIAPEELFSSGRP